MGFLDNSGDIILDAVLTDLGRERLARGDGSFKITKFALGDDEINYGNYDKNHASGSAYYDLEVLQTPILEAFTDNAASLKYPLITYNNLELLFLPVLPSHQFSLKALPIICGSKLPTLLHPKLSGVVQLCVLYSLNCTATVNLGPNGK